MVSVNATLVVGDEDGLLREGADSGEAIEGFGEPGEDGGLRDRIEAFELARSGEVVAGNKEVRI